jgi:hypothetical protein
MFPQMVAPVAQVTLSRAGDIAAYIDRAVVDGRTRNMTH